MIYTRVIGMPTSIKGVTALDGNGDYNIYINANISKGEQIEAYEHELGHIKLNHFMCSSAKVAEDEIKEITKR